jgi:glycosyltransferase involved in cell wall biosynthesis
LSRIIFDLTTTIRWTGPPVGIVRVQRELAMRAYRNPDVRFAFFDPRTLTFRAIAPATADLFLHGEATLDTIGLPDPAKPGGRRSDRIPRVIRPAAMWVLQFRRKLLQALERVRLRAAEGWLRRAIERLQAPLITKKYRHACTKPDGSRRAFLPVDFICSAPIEFRSDDTLLCCGSSWTHLNSDVLGILKRRGGLRLVIMCYDIIPLLFPAFYEQRDVEAFRSYFHAMLPVADLVLCISRKVEDDVRSYCLVQNLALHQTTVIPLGASIRRRPEQIGDLPSGLQAGCYALFVSTIEPRKGHDMIYHVWLRLLEEGEPQRLNFKLVFVGRPGWLNAGLLRALQQDPRLAGTLHVLSDIEDSELDALYRNAAFCIYPSAYEGYGLPLIEAFSYGKAVLSSTGGALPEVAQDLSPCLDPNQPTLWYREIKSWMENPSARAPFEQAIRSRFKPPSWDNAAEALWMAISRLAS